MKNKKNPAVDDGKYMRLALDEAREAETEGEVPIGCVIVRRGEVIASAHNLRESDKRASAHAEHDAIEKACRELGGWRLTECTLYVTVEPCPMCAGLISNAHLPRVVFGAKDAAMGAYGSVMDMRRYPLYKPDVTGGVMEEECGEMMREFFGKIRGKRKK